MHPIESNAGPCLRSQVTQTLIVAYKEDTTALEQVLQKEGLPTEVLRPSYTQKELEYSLNIRCFLNHASAWRRASATLGMTLVVEADFVPCIGLGTMQLPFDPRKHTDNAWAFLYTGGPRMFRQFCDGAIQGHSACAVAYIITPRVARWLVEYAEEELGRHGDLTKYSTWDTSFQWALMGKGAVCFMPYRNYGEHGGFPNFEHKRAGLGIAARHPWLSRLGIGGNHYADVLAGPLSFLPPYARGSRWKYARTRLEAKTAGLLRLLSGRTVVGSMYPQPMRKRLLLWLRCCRRLCSRY